ncbi:hypothetical protein GWI33_008369 [Rhynchophorus ferrugineus]|uniref:Uncharacterized protein n=1 Tax=Rhynchophorus ferrugineus TaxID=354439 RepID=A0A834IVW3_RHYFE|nr:hypothetical protein GWI33_008369 [Rhynchophorus ferrugineus]
MSAFTTGGNSSTDVIMFSCPLLWPRSTHYNAPQNPNSQYFKVLFTLAGAGVHLTSKLNGVVKVTKATIYTQKDTSVYALEPWTNCPLNAPRFDK